MNTMSGRLLKLMESVLLSTYDTEVV